MKTKLITALIVICISAFSLPVSTYALVDDPPEEVPEVVIETPEPTPEPAEPNPFTPDGQATVVDEATEEDGKAFYTFTTPAGNVFYLIIDHQRENNNVYFLNAVTEYDLMTLAEQSEDVNIPESAIPTPEPPPDTTGDDPAETDPLPDEAEPEQDKKSNSSTIIFVVLGVLAVGGAGYYIKIVRPKKQGANDEYGPDEDDYDESEDYEGEAEPEDSADDAEDDDDEEAADGE